MTRVVLNGVVLISINSVSPCPSSRNSCSETHSTRGGLWLAVALTAWLYSTCPVAVETMDSVAPSFISLPFRRLIASRAPSGDHAAWSQRSS